MAIKVMKVMIRAGSDKVKQLLNEDEVPEGKCMLSFLCGRTKQLLLLLQNTHNQRAQEKKCEQKLKQKTEEEEGGKQKTSKATEISLSLLMMMMSWRVAAEQV